MLSQEEFEIQYKKLNDSYKDKLIFKIGDSAGFFSEFYIAALAIAYCLTHRIKFVLTDGKANFAPDTGFEEFFEPFYKTDKRKFAYKKNFRYLNNDYNDWKKNPDTKNCRIKVAIYKFLMGAKFYTQDLFKNITDFKYDPLKPAQFIQNCDLDLRTGDDFALITHIIRMLWKLNEKTLARKQEILEKLKNDGFNENKFVAMQFRKGDKYLENAFSPPFEKYIEQIKKLTDTRDILLLCDDLETYEQMRGQYSDFKFYTICEPMRGGYVNDDLNKADKNLRAEKVRDLIINMDLSLKSEFFIGTKIANPMFFIRHMMPQNKYYVIERLLEGKGAGEYVDNAVCSL